MKSSKGEIPATFGHNITQRCGGTLCKVCESCGFALLRLNQYALV
jgi:hypothetical protein